MAPAAGSVAVDEHGNFVRIIRPHQQCKCCRPQWQMKVLELLLHDHLAAKSDRRGLEGIVRELAAAGLGLSRPALRNHRDVHCEFGDSVGTELAIAERDPREREVDFRSAAEVELAREHVVDARGAHIAYLEDVVNVAALRVRHFPEQVTIEMGLRAASELTKAKQNAERDELLKLLALSATRSDPAGRGRHRTGGSIGQGRERATAKRMLPVLEAQVTKAQA